MLQHHGTLGKLMELLGKAVGRNKIWEVTCWVPNQARAEQDGLRPQQHGASGLNLEFLASVANGWLMLR